jgi:CRP-like cAMP-binding protein
MALGEHPVLLIPDREESVWSLLRNHPFTRDLTDAQVTDLASIARVVDFCDGEFVLRAGEPATSLYLIVSGGATVDLSLTACTAAVQCLGSGDIFGWSSILGDAESLFQVRAGNALTVVRLDGGELLKLCRADSQLGVNLLHRLVRVVAGRVRATEDRFARLVGAGCVVEPRQVLKPRRARVRPCKVN